MPAEGTYSVTVTATAPDGTERTVAVRVEVKDGEVVVEPSGCNAGMLDGVLGVGVLALLKKRR